MNRKLFKDIALKRLMILFLVISILFSGIASADQYKADEAYEIVNNCRVTLLNCRDAHKRNGTLSDRTVELMYYTAKMLVAAWNIAKIQEKDQEPTIIGYGADLDILNEDQIDIKWQSFLRGVIEKETFIEELIDYCWTLIGSKYAPLDVDAVEDGDQEEGVLEESEEEGANSSD